MIERDPASGLPICIRGHVGRRSAKTGECLECRKLYNAKFYAARREEQQARCRLYAAENKEERRQYRLANPEINRKACANWAKRHPDRKRAVENRRRARKANAGGSYTAQDIADLTLMQRGRCAYCRTKLTRKNRHIDHIQPISCGGSSDRTNLQLLCQPCNSSKGARDPVVFAQSLGRLL